MKKILALALALCMIFALCACGQQSTTAATATSADTTDVLYHAHNSIPYVTLDPSSEVSNGIMVLQNVYESLTRYNYETGEVDPVLATSWSVSDDGLTWTFQLRDDVVFHDGSKMTAQNVVNSINRTIEIGEGAAYIWDAVESVEATGDYEVVFNCSYAAPIDIIASAAYASFVMSDSVIDKDVNWFNEGNDGGTGPYTIAQVTGDTVVLKAFDGYRGGWADNQYKTVFIKETSESSARRQLLETGEAQITSDLSSTDYAALAQETNIVHSYVANTYTNVVLCLNTAAGPTANKEFRQALAYAFPYEETVNDVLEGRGVQSYGFVPSGLWGHDESLFQYTTDLDKAKELLDASGVFEEGMELTMTYMNGDDDYASFAQLWQVNLKKLGIDLKLVSMEWDNQWAMALNTDPTTRQDIFVFQWWPDYASPASWFDTLILSQDEITFNLAYVNNPELDALCLAADELQATDRDAAEELYVQIQQTAIDESYYVLPYDMARQFIVSNTIDGVYENPAYATVVQYYNVVKA